MRKFLVALLAYAMAVAPAWSQATLLPNAKQTFLDGVGNPLSQGQVFFYVPGSTNKKTTWSTFDQTSNNTNPIILDSAGRAVIFGQGDYRQVVKDKNGNTIWDSFTSAPGSAEPTGATGTDTAPVGSIMTWSGFTLPINWAFANGAELDRTDYAALMQTITITDTSVSCVSGSTSLGGFADTSQIRIGSAIEATCLPTGTTITSVPSSNSVVVSLTAIATETTTATVFPWGNGDGALTFNIPDLRGYTMAGSDSMGTTAANRLQVTSNLTTTNGSTAATVASATGIGIGMYVQSPNVPSGTTVVGLNGTAVTLSGNASATGTVSTTFAVMVDVNHSGGTGGSMTQTLIADTLPQMTLNTTIPSGQGSHSHSYTVAIPQNQTAAGPNPSGVTLSSSTTGSATLPQMTGTTALDGHSAPFTVMQPTIVMNYIIKIKSNSTGAGGVMSLGGMFGDIACDDTFQCAPQGTSPAVNYIGLAQQPDKTLLANITGGTSQPTPATMTEWMDAVCGSDQGSVVYRGASTWDCLGPSTNNFVLTTRGPGQNPDWSPAGSGTVTGPGSSTNNALPRWDGTNGVVLKDSLVIVDDVGNTSSPGALTFLGGLNSTPVGNTAPDEGTFTSVLGSTGGSVSTPTFTWTGNDDTGMWSPGPGIVAFSAGGVNRVTVDSSGLAVDSLTPTRNICTTTGGLLTTTCTSAGILASTSDATGTGALVFATSPTLVTPVLGVATATSINGLTITASTGTLTVANSKTLTASNSITLAGTDSTTWTGPSSNATLAALNIASQTVTGGANVTTQSLTTGNITMNCGTRPIQSITNGGAFTITAPANDGYCVLKVTNDASAGTITFSGFSTGSNTGDALTNVNGDKFMIFVYRAGGDSTYSVKALQ